MDGKGSLLPRRGFLTDSAAMLVGAALGGCRTRAPPEAVGGTSAERAVNAARRFAGVALNVGSESGAQAQSLLRHDGPRWEELTGIRVQVVEMGAPGEQVRRLMAEHQAGTGAIDCASVAPAWLPDLVEAGALEPLDDDVQRYMVAADLDDYLPRYRDIGRYRGHRYGLFDDGDTLLLYYRRDLFEDAGMRAGFAARYNRPLADPREWGWADFVDAARFFTTPQRFGLAPITQELVWSWFQAIFRARGGRFFDPDTMAAEVASPVGCQTMADLVALAAFTPPGGFAEGEPLFVVSTWLSGGAAMATFWPPLARWAERYGPPPIGTIARSLVPGRTGYALLPGAVTELSVGFVLSVMAHSPQKEAAYLFAQWLSSPEVSLERVMLPYALRDPYRRSHIASPAYRALWPSATEYLTTLETAAARAYLDLGITGAADYEASFYVALFDIRQGSEVATAMRRLADAWDAITRRHGRHRQRESYAEWLEHAAPGGM